MLNARSFLAPAAIVAFLTSPVWAQVGEDAKAVLTQSREALQKLDSASFKVHRFATGALAGVLDITGDVKFIHKDADKTKNPVLLKGETKVAGQAPEPFHISFDPPIVTWTEEKTKMINVRRYGQKSEAANQLSKGWNLLIDELSNPEPFKKELEAQALSLEADADVGGTPCKVVKAVRNNGKQEIYWHIGAADHLPRRMELRAGGKEGPSLIVEMTDLKIGGITSKDLEIPIAEGWKQDVKIEEEKPAPVTPDPTQPQPETPAAPPPTLGVSPGGPAPAFALTGADGKQVSLDSLKGQVVVLAFMGSWNEGSKNAAPYVQKLATTYAGKDVKIFGVTCREKNDDAAKKFFADNKLTYGHLLKGDTTAKDYQVKGYPAFCVIGADGKILLFQQGFKGEESLAPLIVPAIDAGLRK